ncbi:unnamed protein product [Rhizophagus irregularis]|nr:unnamed protein product [Rhizophagus irregularis]
MWTPIFQKISSNVDADIPGISVLAWIPNPKGTEKTKIHSSGLLKIGKPRFVSASRWIYRFRLSVLKRWIYRFRLSVLGLWIYGFRHGP